MKCIIIAIAVLICMQTSSSITIAQTQTEEYSPVMVRFVRAFGAEEQLPPILVRTQDEAKNWIVQEGSVVNIEIDIDADVPPNYYMRFIHCDATWREDADNVFLNDITMLRTSNIEWRQSGIQNPYYTYRGRVQIPNLQIQFPVSGNWKAKLYDWDDKSETPVAEARFFVVDMAARSQLDVWNDFYRPLSKAGPGAFAVEFQCTTPLQYMDNQVHKVVVYRNNRWFEPIIIQGEGVNLRGLGETNAYRSSVLGIAQVQKRFRMAGIPAGNEYRPLDITSTAQFPPGLTSPIQIPFTDLRRNSSALFADDDGAMITRNVFGSTDDYVLVELLLDPEGFPSKYDVFAVGSFNSWRILPDWQMHYDPQQRLYRLRQWMRRGRHNYLYATGLYGASPGSKEEVNFEEFEGNNTVTNHTFIGFLYYREIGYGGYDRIIGFAAKGKSAR